MKHFPFKILILCILLPPVLYIITVPTIEKRLQATYTNEIEDIYIGDTTPLLEGSIRIEDAISRNIDRYTRSKKLLGWGVKAGITITTQKNTILYPAAFQTDVETSLSSPSIPVAEDNYRLLNEGLLVRVQVQLAHGKFMSVAVMGTYILLSIGVFLLSFQAGLKKALKDDLVQKEEFERLINREKGHTERLHALNKERDRFSHELNRIKQRMANEREKVSRNEDEMIDEIVALEENLAQNMTLQQEQQGEIETLKEKIDQFEKGIRKSKKQRSKASAGVKKRFQTLYKNVSIHDRAIDGFITLTPELQLKAEEVILQLHDDPKLVTIKRKVFGKKNRETVFEVIFAYKGRLYFRNIKDKNGEILSIGTKHSQGKDLTFLDNL